jgi:antitoxin ParD1/3/4
MPAIERLTVTMPAEMAANLRHAIEGGEYATTSEIVREALRDWTRKHDSERQQLEDLRAAIAEGDKGEGIPAEEVFAEMRALIAERRAATAA